MNTEFLLRGFLVEIQETHGAAESQNEKTAIVHPRIYYDFKTAGKPHNKPTPFPWHQLLLYCVE